MCPPVRTDLHRAHGSGRPSRHTWMLQPDAKKSSGTVCHQRVLHLFFVVVCILPKASGERSANVK